VLLWSDNSVRRDKLEEMKGGSFGIWKNALGSWLLGWSTASNSSDESSLVESSGEGVIGDAGCRRVRSMSDARGRGGSDMLCARREGIEVLEAWILSLYQTRRLRLCTLFCGCWA
jgi:hypothetical protein